MRARSAEVLAILSEYYILYGVQSWTIVGTDRRKVEVTPDSVRAELLEHPDVWMLVEAADDLYHEQVLRDLVRKAERLSPPSQTAVSTSPKRGSRPARRKPSKQSSISTIPTAGTETTSSSLDGVSSSSQSSESAA
jgi:hypothetical protein